MYVCVVCYDTDIGSTIEQSIFEIMSSLRLLYIPIIILISTSCSTSDNTYDGQTENLLLSLDSVLINSEQYEASKRATIDKLLSIRSIRKKPSDIYNTNCSIYDECLTFDSDCAFEAVEANLSYARATSDQEKETEWMIKKSFLLSVTGMLLESDAITRSLDTHQMSRKMLVAYYSQMIYLYAHFGQYLGNGQMHNTYTQNEQAYRDSLISIMQPTDADYVWQRACKALADGKADTASIILEKIVGESALTTREDATNAYALAQMYKTLGNNNLYIRNLAKSSIADIRSGNKDIASLEELAGVIFEQQIKNEDYTSPLFVNNIYLNRANSYINICMQKALSFNNRVRVISISRIIDEIQNSYIKRNIEQQQMLKRYLTIAIILLTLLATAAFYIVRIYRKRKTITLELAEVNKQLRNINSQLEESNYVKEEYIGYVFSLCSNYISKIEEYRKDINRKLTVKKYDELHTQTSKSLLTEEMHEFFNNFDAIFIHIYPDFVEQFNALLQPEARIEPKKGELLNTDLRIYALVRLGINDSVKIAELLHCSPQTVYNNRLKIRNRAIVSKEKFAETVQQLCRKPSNK